MKNCKAESRLLPYPDGCGSLQQCCQTESLQFDTQILTESLWEGVCHARAKGLQACTAAMAYNLWQQAAPLMAHKLGAFIMETSSHVGMPRNCAAQVEPDTRDVQFLPPPIAVLTSSLAPTSGQAI